jgi:hypothetical protein
VEAFNLAVAGLELPELGPGDGLVASSGSFSMRQVVHGGPDGECRTVLRVEDGRLSMETEPMDTESMDTESMYTGEAGAEAPADVTVSLSWDDARALSAGRFAATEAIAGGRVKVRGDLSVLSAAQGLLAAVAPALSQLREQTDR